MSPPSESSGSTSRAEIVAAIRGLYDDGPWFQRVLQRYRPYICPFEELIDRVPSGASVLDVGCGAGLFLLLLAARHRIGQGVGFDTSDRAIALAERARCRLPQPERLRFEFDRGGFTWPRATFDVVSMIDVLHHVPPSLQNQLLRKAAAAVKPGGFLLFKDIGERPVWRALANRAHDLVLARQWIHYLPLATVIETVEQMGLNLVETQRFDVMWYGHELALFQCSAQYR